MAGRPLLVLRKKKWRMIFMLIPIFFLTDLLLGLNIVYTLKTPWYQDKAGLLLFSLALIVALCIWRSFSIKHVFYEDYMFYQGLIFRKTLAYDNIGKLDFNSFYGEDGRFKFVFYDTRKLVQIEVPYNYVTDSGMSGREFLDFIIDHAPSIQTTAILRSFFGQKSDEKT